MENITRIQEAAALSVIGSLSECKDEEARLLGLNQNLISQLIELNLHGQQFIAKKSSRCLSVFFDTDALVKILSELEHERTIRELENNYLKLNAPYKLMRQLFGMHTTNFSSRRRLLGLSGQGQHRPTYCDEKTEVLIWKHWKETEKVESRDRYLRVAKLTKQPLNIIWAAVKRYNEIG